MPPHMFNEVLKLATWLGSNHTQPYAAGGTGGVDSDFVRTPAVPLAASMPVFIALRVPLI